VAGRSAGALAGALALLALAPPARAATQDVSIQFSAFGPAVVDALPADTVTWDNTSVREHTVVADGGAFASDVLPPGATFSFSPSAVGAYAYHCSIHPSMTGEVDVRHVTLGPVPTAPLAPGAKVELTGRTDDPAHAVAIERSTGSGFAPVATATPTASGDWTTTVRPDRTADYRAAVAAGTSETRRVLVNRRTVRLRATRRGVAVSVTPSDPGGHLLLQVRSREHFGWWPLARKRLDFLSEATFTVPAGRRVRVELVDRDGWTALATSKAVRVR
jgi:plastocyanin